MFRVPLLTTTALLLTGCGIFLSAGQPPADVEVLDALARDAVELGPDVLTGGDTEVFVDCIDEDGDGYGAGCTAPDCDDTNGAVFVEREVFVDADGDGHRAESAVLLCTGAMTAEEPTEQMPVDCDESDENRFVESEVLVDADNDDAFVVSIACADGTALPLEYVEDCDDLDGARAPGQQESCNAIDDNCDGIVDDETSCGCEVVNAEGFGPYLFCGAPGTFDGQKIFCEQPLRGYRMVHIENEEEQELLRAEVSRRNQERWYIGLTDRATEGEFLWTNGASLADTGFQDFANGEPNNIGNEDCGVLRSAGWDDVPCGVSYPVICEALP